MTGINTKYTIWVCPPRQEWQHVGQVDTAQDALRLQVHARGLGPDVKVKITTTNRRPYDIVWPAITDLASLVAGGTTIRYSEDAGQFVPYPN
jgi:hypothetical protein